MGGGELKEVRVEMQSESSIVPAIECEDSNVKERKGNALKKHAAWEQVEWRWLV